MVHFVIRHAPSNFYTFMRIFLDLFTMLFSFLVPVWTNSLDNAELGISERVKAFVRNWDNRHGANKK